MMIMSVAPPALRTVTETWRACSASGKRENHLFFSSFLQLQFFFWKTWPVYFLFALYLKLPKSQSPEIQFVKLLFVIPTTSHSSPICLFIQSTCCCYSQFPALRYFVFFSNPPDCVSQIVIVRFHFSQMVIACKLAQLQTSSVGISLTATEST